MTDLSHLHAIELRLSHERSRLAAERSAAGRQLRAVWIAAAEKEIVAERKFLGLAECDVAETSDDDLLAELFSFPQSSQ